MCTIIDFRGFSRMVRDLHLKRANMSKTSFLMDCSYLQELGLVSKLHVVSGYRFDTYALHQFVLWALKVDKQSRFVETDLALDFGFTEILSSHRSSPYATMDAVPASKTVSPTTPNHLKNTSGGVVKEAKASVDDEEDVDIFVLVAKEMENPLAENTQDKIKTPSKKNSNEAKILNDSEWIERTPSLLSDDVDSEVDEADRDQAERMLLDYPKKSK